MAPDRSDVLLDVRNLCKHFPVTRGLIFERTVGRVKAVDDVSFTIRRGEALGLVGESGCGKTTVARCILKLLEPTEGRILFDGQDLSALDADAIKRYRRQVRAIFQDPYSSLNPRMTVGQTVREPIQLHSRNIAKPDMDRQALELLDVCGLPRAIAERYPHEMSGGQRQRVGIARALALKPQFIVCDEAVSALDVSIQAQIINLLEELQAEFGLTYLFIGHDLSVIRHLCQRVAVMYLGKLVELADCDDLFEDPMHPYARALLDAVPIPDPPSRRSASTGSCPARCRAPSTRPRGACSTPAAIWPSTRAAAPCPRRRWPRRTIGWPVPKCWRADPETRGRRAPVRAGGQSGKTAYFDATVSRSEVDAARP